MGFAMRCNAIGGVFYQGWGIVPSSTNQAIHHRRRKHGRFGTLKQFTPHDADQSIVNPQAAQMPVLETLVEETIAKRKKSRDMNAKRSLPSVLDVLLIAFSGDSKTVVPGRVRR